MGTFSGHLLPGTAFSLLGLWHTFQILSSHNSPTFRSRSWHPFSLLRHLEPILLLSFSLLAAAVQLFSPTADSLEHAAIFSHVIVHSLAAILVDKIDPKNEALLSLSSILVTNVFAQELFLLGFHSTDHVGIEGHYHFLLRIIVFVCLVSSLCATFYSSCFPCALLRSMALTFQGVWFIVMGFCLWVPRFMARDCYPSGSNGGGFHGGAVVCESVEADGWARVLANLQFSLAGGGVCMITLGICLAKGREMEYKRLMSGALDVEHLNSGREGDLKEVRV